MQTRSQRIPQNSMAADRLLYGAFGHSTTLKVVLLLLGLLALGGCSGGGTEQKAPPPPEVSILTVAPRRVELTTELAGRTSAVEIAEVRPQVSGIILERLFTEGAEVKKGQQLYQIDPALYQAALNETNASLARAQANLTTSKLLAERYAQVVDSRAVSRQEYDNAAAAYEQAKAGVAASRAAVDTAAINVRYTKVYSPIDGHIGISSVTPGALVTANQPNALATVQRLDEMYVDVTQSTADILRLKRGLMKGQLVPSPDGGARVSLILEDGTPYDQEGVLQLSDVSVDQGTGSVTVRAKFPNPKRELGKGTADRMLFPGMFVRAILQDAVNEKALMLPLQAVGRDTMGRPTVYALNDDGTVREEVIVLDRTLGKEYLVRSGIKEGDKIIVDGRIKIRPGARVRAIPFVPDMPKAGGE